MTPLLRKEPSTASLLPIALPVNVNSPACVNPVTHFLNYITKIKLYLTILCCKKQPGLLLNIYMSSQLKFEPFDSAMHNKFSVYDKK